MIDTTRYQATLETALAEITAELQDIAAQDPVNPMNWVPKTDDIEANEADEIDVADKTEEWVERTSEVAALERQFNDITRALKKIEVGTYGICEVSGNEIEMERLDANPAARTCVVHREEEETLPR